MERSSSTRALGIPRRPRRNWSDAGRLAGAARRFIDLHQPRALHDITLFSPARPRSQAGKELRSMLRALGMIAALVVASIALAGG
jgi:hypothetical protein